MKVITILLFVVISVSYATEGFVEKVCDHRTESISGKELKEYLMALETIEMGECYFSNIHRSRNGIGFRIKRGWRVRDFELPIADDEQIRVEHSRGATMIMHYPQGVSDGLYMQFSFERELVHIDHYYQVSLFEKFFVKSEDRFNECILGKEINDSDRGQVKETETDSSGNYQQNAVLN